MPAKQANIDKSGTLRPCTVVYVALTCLTLVTWLVSRMGLSGLDISLSVLLLALIKGLLIGDYYMGLRMVHGLWRLPILIWLLLPGSLITWAFVTSG